MNMGKATKAIACRHMRKLACLYAHMYVTSTQRGAVCRPTTIHLHWATHIMHLSLINHDESSLITSRFYAQHQQSIGRFNIDICNSFPTHHKSMHITSQLQVQSVILSAHQHQGSMYNTKAQFQHFLQTFAVVSLHLERMHITSKLHVQHLASTQ